MVETMNRLTDKRMDKEKVEEKIKKKMQEFRPWSKIWSNFSWSITVKITQDGNSWSNPSQQNTIDFVIYPGVYDTKIYCINEAVKAPMHM